MENDELKKDESTQSGGDVGCAHLLAFGCVMVEGGLRKYAVAFTMTKEGAERMCRGFPGKLLKVERTPQYDMFRVSHSPFTFYDPTRAFQG